MESCVSFTHVPNQIVYCCWIAFELVYCYLFVIETKNRTLRGGQRHCSTEKRHWKRSLTRLRFTLVSMSMSVTTTTTRAPARLTCTTRTSTPNKSGRAAALRLWGVPYPIVSWPGYVVVWHSIHFYFKGDYEMSYFPSPYLTMVASYLPSLTLASHLNIENR